MMKSRNILFFLCLIVAGIGYLPASKPKKVKANKYGVKESVSIELFSKKKQEDGKVTFKCRITSCNGMYMMFAKILKNDSSLHVKRQGIKFTLAKGDTVVLKPERDAACCSNWADGRWYNTSFKINVADVEKLKSSDIVSLTIPFYGGKISRNTASGKEGAIASLLQSVGED